MADWHSREAITEDSEALNPGPRKAIRSGSVSSGVTAVDAVRVEALFERGERALDLGCGTRHPEFDHIATAVAHLGRLEKRTAG